MMPASSSAIAPTGQEVDLVLGDAAGDRRAVEQSVFRLDLDRFGVDNLRRLQLKRAFR
jgi:hypothetical protein